MVTSRSKTRSEANALLRVYGLLPYLFFIFMACCYVYSEVVWGGISWQNPSAPYPTGYELFNLYADIILIPTVLGMLILPLILLVKLFIKPRSGWQRMFPAIVSYTLFFYFVMLAGHMGWWID